MIVEISVKGSERTSYHTFKIQQNNEGFGILPGAYYCKGEKVFEITKTALFPFSMPTSEVLHYQLIISKEKMQLIERKDSEDFPQPPADVIDRLAYFTVNAGVSDFSEVTIHFINIKNIG